MRTPLACNLLLLLILLLYRIQHAHSTICSNTNKGQNTASSYPVTTDASASAAYVNLDDTWMVDCYGVLKSFSIRCQNSGDITFNVWRPDGGDDFINVGSYTFTGLDCTGTITMYQHGVGVGWAEVFTVSDSDTASNANSGNEYTSYLIPDTSYAQWLVCRDINYQTCVVYNPGTSGYVAYGDNVGSVRNVGRYLTLTIPNEWEYIPVRPGDRIGIQQWGHSLLTYYSYFSGSSSASQYQAIEPAASLPAPGDIWTFGTAVTYNRNYALYFNLDEGMTPVFNNLDASIQIAENVAIGTFLYSVRVKDWNLEEWPLTGDPLEYDLATHTTIFAIDSSGVITTAASLDYETVNRYEIEVIVRDFPDRAWTTGTVTLDVTDVNEDITSINLPAIVTEDATTLTSGYQVFDVDATSDIRYPAGSLLSNVDLEYILVSQTPNNGYWQIDATNGQITSTASLENTQYRRYTLNIAVKETDGTYTTGAKTLDIIVNNVNQPPYFTNLPATISFPEDYAGGGLIYTATADDVDGDVLSITMDTDLIRPYSGGPLFTYANPVVFLVTIPEEVEIDVVGTPFDFETVQTYTLPFKVTDTLFASQTYTLKVEVTDVNEVPVCPTTTYKSYIYEKLPVGTVIHDIVFSVSDPDAGDYHTYQVIGDLTTVTDARYFTTQGDELTILNEIDLDLAVSTSYNFEVEAVDSGGLSCTCTVDIVVMDVNDGHAITNLPRVVELNALTTTTGDLVYTVAVGPQETNDVFTYSMATPVPSDGLFSLDAETGAVTVTRSLSGWTFDSDPSMYNLSITVTDEQGESSGPLALVFTISNPRHPPEIDNLPAHQTYKENFGSTNHNKLLFSIAASDSDGIGISEYELTLMSPPLEENEFLFLTNTGQLYLKVNNVFDFERYEDYSFTFRAKDDYHWSEEKILTISITDVNEAPNLDPRVYSVTLPEETPVGTTLSLSPRDLNATDEDAGAYITYKTGSDLFTALGGRIVVSRQYDRETETAPATFAVYVRDQYGLEDNGFVTLTFTDINDNTPIFRKSYYNATTTESAWGGTKVLSVIADDADTGVNSQIQYAIRNLNDDSGSTYFRVDGSTGIIYVKHRPNHQLFPVVTFEILAIDKGSPALTGTSTITIDVTDENDVVPIFETDYYNLDIPCTEPVGTTIVTVSATDTDTSAVSNLEYFYLRFNKAYALGPSSGELTIREPLQCGARNMVYILARDRNTTEGYSNVCLVRVNQYNPMLYTVDLYLAVPIGQYENISAAFITTLNGVISPWTAYVKDVRGELDRNLNRRKKRETAQDTSTIVALYAVANTINDDIAFVSQSREFIPKDSLLELLRKDIAGTPQDILNTPAFAEFFVTKVEPEEENWFLDTAGGIATVAMLVLLGIGALVVLMWAIASGKLGKFWNCDACRPRVRRIFIRRKKEVRDESPSGEGLFSLRYKHPEEYNHTGAKSGSGTSGKLSEIIRNRLRTPPKVQPTNDVKMTNQNRNGRESASSYLSDGGMSRAASPGQVGLDNLSPEPQPYTNQAPPPSYRTPEPKSFFSQASDSSHRAGRRKRPTARSKNLE